MQVLSVLTPPPTITDIRFVCLLVCRMVNVSMQHGMSGASAHGFAHLGSILGPVFHRYSEAGDSPSSPANLLRNTASLPIKRRPTIRWARCSVDASRITAAIDFPAGDVSSRTENG